MTRNKNMDDAPREAAMTTHTEHKAGDAEYWMRKWQDEVNTHAEVMRDNARLRGELAALSPAVDGWRDIGSVPFNEDVLLSGVSAFRNSPMYVSEGQASRGANGEVVFYSGDQKILPASYWMPKPPPPTLSLSKPDQEQLVKAIENPPEPSQALKEAYKNSKEGTP